MSDYTTGQFSQTNVQAMSHQMSVSDSVRALIEIVGFLTHEVSRLNERMHGGAQIASGGNNDGIVVISAWADELRDATITSRLRAESAMIEISRIRETLGL